MHIRAFTDTKRDATPKRRQGQHSRHKGGRPLPRGGAERLAPHKAPATTTTNEAAPPMGGGARPAPYRAPVFTTAYAHHREIPAGTGA